MLPGSGRTPTTWMYSLPTRHGRAGGRPRSGVTSRLSAGLEPGRRYRSSCGSRRGNGGRRRLITPDARLAPCPQRLSSSVPPNRPGASAGATVRDEPAKSCRGHRPGRPGMGLTRPRPGTGGSRSPTSNRTVRSPRFQGSSASACCCAVKACACRSSRPRRTRCRRRPVACVSTAETRPRRRWSMAAWKCSV